MLPISSLYAPVTIQNSPIVSAQEQEKGIIISPFLLKKIIQKSQWSEEELSSSLRRVFISKLVSAGFSGFVTRYPDYTLSYASGGTLFAWTGIANSGLDQLDFWIHKNIVAAGILSGSVAQLLLPESVYSQWKGIELFQSIEDLQQMGYEVVSFRTRINKDQGYRRHNIATAFHLFGNIRVVNPWQILSFYKNIDYDPTLKKNYLNGTIIKDDREIPEYGWGICGGSTALYQGMVTNTALERLQVRSHSKWYHALYTATINGTKITTPGIDSTIYNGSPDLVFQNITDHPIIVVSNYNGVYGSGEENFTLWFASDKGSLEYIGSEPKNFVVDGKKRRGKCYTWKINGIEKKSCYNQLK